MNLTAARLALRTRIGNPSATDVPDTPNLDQHLNNAYEEILDKYRFLRGRGRAKFTTTIGADKYVITSITDTLLKVWDRTNKRELKKATQDFSASNDYLSPTNGKPEFYLRYENYIQLWPPPDGAYQIEMLYKAKMTPLAAGADTPVLPQVWHRGMVILAAAIYYDDEGGDPAKATYHYNIFKMWVADKPLEADEELADLESGVELPTLGIGSQAQRLDFDHSP